MWYRICSRKEFLEILLSTGRERNANAEYLKISPDFSKSKDSILLAWERDPVVHTELPCLAAAHDSDISDLLAAVNASPQAPSPFTSFCRLISREDYSQYKESDSLDLSSEDISPFIALAYAEALVHAEGQIKQADLSPAICNRTLAMSWAKAISRKVPFSQLPSLMQAWLDVYMLTGANEKSSKARQTVSSLAPVLMTLTELQLGGSTSSPELALCRALSARAKEQQEAIWAPLRVDLIDVPTISGIAEATREQRANFFQSAVQKKAPAFVLGFLASQISPGSLDHMELAIGQSDVQVAFWYAAFAALARPAAVMTAHGGQGSRLLRIAGRSASFGNSPQCDISYAELGVLARAGLDHLSRKLEHSGEICVELVPLVSCTFRFSFRPGRTTDASEQDRVSRQKLAQERMRDQLLYYSRALEALAFSGAEQMELEQPVGVRPKRVPKR